MEQSVEESNLIVNHECFSLRCDSNWRRAGRAEYQLSPERSSCVFHDPGTPVRVAQAGIFRMRNVIMETPLRFWLMSERVEPIDSRLVMIRRIVLAQAGDSKHERKESENYSATLHNEGHCLSS